MLPDFQSMGRRPYFIEMRNPIITQFNTVLLLNNKLKLINNFLIHPHANICIHTMARIPVYFRTQTDPLAYADMETAIFTQARCILGHKNVNDYILVSVFI